MDVLRNVNRYKSGTNTKVEYTCLNCGKKIDTDKTIYSRIFCSDECKEDYLSSRKK